MNALKKNLTKIYHTVLYRFVTKESSELDFWRSFLLDVQKWYQGTLPSLYEEKNPSEKDKIIVRSAKDSAVLTWFEIHQKRKYLEDLLIAPDYFSGMKVLDIGAGPIPSALAFTNCEVYCLDPLLGDYIKIGFPIHYYDRAKFICAYSEAIPLPDGFIDAVISVNAIDHVDDLHATAREIQRVLKPQGKLRMHIHYHTKSVTEPVEINDAVVQEVFGWCSGFKKVSESNRKRGFVLKDEHELYTVWSN